MWGRNFTIFVHNQSQHHASQAIYHSLAGIAFLRYSARSNLPTFTMRALEWAWSQWCKHSRDCDWSPIHAGGAFSWCFHSNPARVPFLFNYNCTRCDRFPYTCDGDDYNSDCRLTRRIQTLEVANADGGEFVAYATFTTLNGLYILFDLGREEVCAVVVTGGYWLVCSLQTVMLIDFTSRADLERLEVGRFSSELSYVVVGTLDYTWILPLHYDRERWMMYECN